MAAIIKGGFRQRKLPLAADYRPMYKIGLITLILHTVSAGNKSSLNKLHFFVWALKSKRNMDFIMLVMETSNTSSIVSWGVEPALNKSLAFGVAENLFSIRYDRYTLTEKGIALAKQIEKDKELLVQEKIFLGFIGKRKVTETFIADLTRKTAG